MLDTPTDEGFALAVVKPPSPNKFKGLNSNNENKGEMYKPPINKADLCQANIALVDDKSIQDSTSSSSEMGGLNKEEIKKLRSLLTSLDKPVGSYSLAHSGEHLSEDKLNFSLGFDNLDISAPKTLIPSAGSLSPAETSGLFFQQKHPCL
ncbi:hypothetical protein F0562_002891 [Nyssa sinensis]|uniref:Uncharacterized protein n=1 Tax=Nyssa sinensis TaxID=561372 RepID=A0A5J5BWB5_9ASTE|nr:hypothetical protein F0562_002891 [Nyssa sinensis]